MMPSARTELLRASHLRIFISIASIPQRLHLIDKTVQSFAKQTFPVEKILLVLPYKYTRWPLLQPNISLVHAHALLEIHRCEIDDGPGTKSLCAVPRLAVLLGVSWTSWPARPMHNPTHTNAVLILADDDREYKSSALALIADSMLYSRRFARDAASTSLGSDPVTIADDGGGSVLSSALELPALAQRAFSFATNPLPNSQIANASVPSLIVGQGADLFALPLDALLRHNMRGYFELCVCTPASLYTVSLPSLSIPRPSLSLCIKSTSCHLVSLHSGACSPSTTTITIMMMCGSQASCRTLSASQSAQSPSRAEARAAARAEGTFTSGMQTITSHPTECARRLSFWDRCTARGRRGRRRCAGWVATPRGVPSTSASEASAS